MIGLMRGKWLSGAVLGAILSFLPLACAGEKFESDGADGSTACNEALNSCGKGTTCWVAENRAGYECLPSGTRLQGDPCLLKDGLATCADGLFCVPLRSGAVDKNCSPRCDPGDPNGCKRLTANAVCNEVRIAGLPSIYACGLPQ
jgi:hypothetical protein